jgi:hypothetical protein
LVVSLETALEAARTRPCLLLLLLLLHEHQAQQLGWWRSQAGLGRRHRSSGIRGIQAGRLHSEQGSCG